LDAVIMNVARPSALVRTMHRIVRILFYDDIRFVIYSAAGATSIGLIVTGVLKRKKKAKTTEELGHH
jgi:hypothetical protein